MGAAGSVPSSIEEAREQGISEEDITKYIVEHEGDVIVAAAGSDPDEKTEDVTDKTAESSSAPDEKTEDAIDKTTESSSEPDEKTEDAIAYEVGMKVEVSSQYGWDPAKVTAVQGDGKYTVFSYSGYYLNETVEDIPGNRIRASTAVEEKKEPPDENGMQIGLAVEVCDCFGSDDQWLPAVITCIQEDGDYTVECTEGYYLGDTEEGVIFDRIRLEGEEKEYVDYTKMTVRKLRDMLRTRGAEAARLGFPDKELYKTKGRKTQLIERLIEADRIDAERAALAPVSEVEKRRREEEARLAALRAAHAAKLERANFPVREAMAEAAMMPLPQVSDLQRATHALDDGTDTISFQPPSSDEEEEEEQEEEEEVETPAEDGEKAANDDASGNNQQVVEGKADVVEGKTDVVEGKTDGAEAKKDEAGAKKDGAEEEKKTVVDDESKEDQSQESKKTDDTPKEKPINWKAVSEDIRIVHKCFVEKKLPYLDLSMKRIDGDALAAIIEESDPKLHTLKLWKSVMNDREMVPWINKLCDNTSLTSLDLSETNASNVVATSLGQMLRENEHLTTLRLRQHRFSPRHGVSALCAALCEDNSTLTELDLSSSKWVKPENRMDETCAMLLAECLKTNKALRVLNLDCNALGEVGAIALSKVMSNTGDNSCRLTKLGLQYNQVKDGGAGAISEMLKTNTALKELRLSNNKISTKGALVIAEGLAENNTLTRLEVARNFIALAGKDALFDITGNRLAKAEEARAEEAKKEEGKSAAVALAPETVAALTLTVVF